MVQRPTWFGGARSSCRATIGPGTGSGGRAAGLGRHGRDGSWQQVLATNTAIEEPAEARTEARAAARAARLAVAEEPDEER
jgi:hypothetical protein